MATFGRVWQILFLSILLGSCVSCVENVSVENDSEEEEESIPNCQYDETKDHMLYYFGLDKFESLTDKTVDECKTACEESTEFECLSINYKTSESSCVLSALSTTVKPWPELDIKPWPGTDYYEKKECTPKCVFDEFEAYALYGFNNLILKGKTVAECKEICLEMDDPPCLSFDYTVDSGTCYFSSESRHTQTDEFGPHGETVYFEPHCDGTIPVIKYARECLFPKASNTALKSGRDMMFPGELEDCLRIVRMWNDRWTDIKSFDYYHTSKRCYISTDDKETYSEHYGPQENVDYYGIECELIWPTRPPPTLAPGAPVCNYVKQTDRRIFLGSIYKFWWGGLATCTRYCQSEYFPTCRSIEYERATGICTLMSRSSTNNELYEWSGYDFYEKECEALEDEEDYEGIVTEEESGLDRENCIYDERFDYYLPSDDELLPTRGLGYCFWGCIENQDGCKSINYFHDAKHCQQNQNTIATSESELQENSSALYIERKCADVLDATGCRSDWVPFGSKCYNMYSYWELNDIRDNSRERCDRRNSKPAFIQSKQELKFLAKFLKTDIEFDEMWTKQAVNITAWWIGGISKIALKGSLLTDTPNNIDTFPAIAYTGEDMTGIAAYSKDTKLQVICEQERAKVTCPNFLFQCKQYGCVSSSWVCDGQADCNDETDEHNCPADRKRSIGHLL